MIAAVIMAITIIGLPWARAAFNIGVYSLLPFGQQAVNRDQITGQHDFGTGPFGLVPFGTQIGSKVAPFVQGIVDISVASSAVAISVQGAGVGIGVESAAAGVGVT